MTQHLAPIPGRPRYLHDGTSFDPGYVDIVGRLSDAITALDKYLGDAGQNQPLHENDTVDVWAAAAAASNVLDSVVTIIAPGALGTLATEPVNDAWNQLLKSVFEMRRRADLVLGEMVHALEVRAKWEP